MEVLSSSPLVYQPTPPPFAFALRRAGEDQYKLHYMLEIYLNCDCLIKRRHYYSSLTFLPMPATLIPQLIGGGKAKAALPFFLPAALRQWAALPKAKAKKK